MPYFLALTFLLAPAYALRFTLLGFPANLLMVWVIFVWVAVAAVLTTKHQWADFFSFLKDLDKKILILTGLFFLAGMVSLFVKGFDRAKLGQFVVLFLQPISIFFITGFTIKQQPKTRRLLFTSCYLLLAAMGIYAIIQYFTLLGLPPAWWGNSDEPKRALGFFGHPNFYALFAAPLLAFLVPDVFRNLGSKILDPKLIAWLLGAAGLFLSLSRAGWLGLGVAVLAYLIVAADKKLRRMIFAAAAVLFIVILILPNLRYRMLLPFYGEKSAVSRLSLWTTGWKGIKESPVTGLGLNGFARQWPILNTDPGLASASHNFPHNIFLDLWVETGILGLGSLLGLIGLHIYRGLRSADRSFLGSNNIATTDGPANLKLAAALFLIAVIFAGLVDNPYFKNDLAMVFWMILSLPT